jgi:hypothetical protein
MKGVWLWLVLCIGGIHYGVVWEVVCGFFINGVSRFPLANYAFKVGIKATHHSFYTYVNNSSTKCIAASKKSLLGVWTEPNITQFRTFSFPWTCFCQNGVSSYLPFVSIASTICDFWSKEKVAGVWTATHRT